MPEGYLAGENGQHFLHFAGGERVIQSVAGIQNLMRRNMRQPLLQFHGEVGTQFGPPCQRRDSTRKLSATLSRL